MLFGDDDNDDDDNDDVQARMLDEYNRKFSSISNILNKFLRRGGRMRRREG